MNTTTADTTHDSNQSGMLLMAGAMLLLPMMDSMAKLLSTNLGPGQIAFVRFLIQALLLGTAVTATRQISPMPAKAKLKTALAGVFVAGTITCLYWSLAFLPLANAIAIFFVEPLLLTLLSAWVLREKMSKQRLMAVLLGLLGVLVVIRPNWDLFGWVALLPLLAALFYAAHLTVLRSITATLGSLQVQACSSAWATALLGIGILLGGNNQTGIFTWAHPSPRAWCLLLAIGLLSVISHMMITLAFKHTQASVLASFQYLEIISATLLGYVLFQDFPDILTWLGTLIILAAGSYVFYTERKRSRSTPEAAR
ncbi:MAG: DMT family transporter [Desulfuromonadaceae bacterium]